MFSHSLPTRIAASSLISLACGMVQAEQVRGVNPADIDSRVDVIFKRVALDPSGSAQSLTFKYDYKLAPEWGLNFELPVVSRLSLPGRQWTGNGDLFARARWIVTAGTWSYGASLETVLPLASKDELGTGRYQLNVAGLLVKVFSPSFIAAGALKQTTGVGGDSARASFSNTEVRLVPVFILPGGWAITGELRQTWEHRTDFSWQRVELTLNKQFDANWAGSMSASRDFSDRRDGGGASVALKYFF
jgi:hypothetical protein